MKVKIKQKHFQASSANYSPVCKDCGYKYEGPMEGKTITVNLDDVLSLGHPTCKACGTPWNCEYISTEG